MIHLSSPPDPAGPGGLLLVRAEVLTKLLLQIVHQRGDLLRCALSLGLSGGVGLWLRRFLRPLFRRLWFLIRLRRGWCSPAADFPLHGGPETIRSIRKTVHSAIQTVPGPSRPGEAKAYPKQEPHQKEGQYGPGRTEQGQQGKEHRHGQEDASTLPEFQAIPGTGRSV